MKTFLITLILFQYALVGFSQFEKFDLSKYKLPDINRKKLDFSMDLNTISNVNYPNSGNHLNSLRNSSNIGYSGYKNSRKIQSESNLSFTFNTDNNSSREKKDFLISKSNRMDARANYNLELRRYLKKHFYFLVAPTLGYSGSKESTKTNINQIQNSMNLNSEILIAPGIGRIEPVGDLRHAIYILDDLQKNNRLSRIPSEKEVVDISSYISKLKNKRYFDSRIKRIEELTTLDSLIESKKLKNNADIKYFTSLNDFWIYGDEYRESGKRFQIGPKYRMNYNISSSTEKKQSDLNFSDNMINFKYINNQYSVYLSYEYRKPIGLKWQKNWDVFSAFEHNRYKDFIGNKLKIKSNELFLFSSLKYSWFLNTRTNLGFNLDGRCGFDFKPQHIPLDLYLNLRIGGNLNYYFSPRLRLSYFMNFNCYNYNSNIGNPSLKLNFTNQLAFRYSIF